MGLVLFKDPFPNIVIIGLSASSVKTSTLQAVFVCSTWDLPQCEQLLPGACVEKKKVAIV